MIPSDLEHSSDNHDVKDLSFRSQPQQAAIITSTAPIIHLETSNHDIESSRGSSSHQDNMINQHESVLRTVRMRKFSETMPDHEHHNNYKFKNYIQQRFSHENHHDDNGVLLNLNVNGKSCSENGVGGKKRKTTIQSDSIEYSSCDEKPTTNGITDIKSEILTPNQNGRVKSNMVNGHAFAVPIFALHGQGTFYVPLNIDYETLLPYLGGVNLLDKNFNGIPPLHPININVSFSHAVMKNISRPKIENMVNGW